MHTTGNLVPDTFYAAPEEIGLAIADAADAGTVTVINATPVSVDDRCPDCGNCDTRRCNVTRRLVDLSVVGFPTRLHARVPRFTCGNEACGGKIFQASLTFADDGAKLTWRVTRWILQHLATGRMSLTATAKAPGVGWELVNRIAVEAVRDLVYADPDHLDGVRILGVDEHVRQTRLSARRTLLNGHRLGGPDPTGRRDRSLPVDQHAPRMQCRRSAYLA